MKRKWYLVVSICMAMLLAMSGCGNNTQENAGNAAETAEVAAETTETQEEEATQEGSEEVHLQIFSTSDIHGKYLPYDYALNTESLSGSMAQVRTALEDVKADDNYLLVDVGDSIQANFAHIFLDYENHPFAQAVNLMDYDIWSLGNHEFNFGVNKLEDVMDQIGAEILCGNVYYPNGDRLADNYTIIEKNGVRIGIIGMVTPNITKWDAANLEGYTVTNPVDETKAAIEEIKDQVDVLIAAVHMSEDNEYEVYGSGATDLAEACPELDVILAAHGHKLVEESFVNGVLVTENKNSAQTMIEVNLTLTEDGNGGYTVSDKSSRGITVSEYDPDPEVMTLLEWADEIAKEEANKEIGEFVSDSLAPENEIAEIPQARIQETSLIDLINEVQMYYTDADISATALFIDDANLYKGVIRQCDLAQIYKYENTLYKLEITGSQLKKYMEWTAQFYNTWKPGDLTISFNPDMPGFNYDMFSGISYEINIAKEPGNRIENLCKADGSPVQDDDVFIIAVNNYRANSQLLCYGEVFKEGEELPKLLEMDVCGDIGGMREIIGDYIVNVKGGTLEAPALQNNWKITGNDWDEEKHEEVVELLQSGELTYETLENVEDGKSGSVIAITEDDLAAVKS